MYVDVNYLVNAWVPENIKELFRSSLSVFFLILKKQTSEIEEKFGKRFKRSDNQKIFKCFC